MRFIKIAIFILALISLALVVLALRQSERVPNATSLEQRATGPDSSVTKPNVTAATTLNTPAFVTKDERAYANEPSGPPAARVNGKTITTEEVETELTRLLISAKTHDGMEQEKRDELRKVALDELIVRELAYQKAKSSGLAVDPLQLVAETRRIRNRYHTKKSFDEALAAERITEQQLRERVERDLLLKKMFQLEIEDRAKVSEAEVRQHYETNKEKFVVPESVQFKGILIKIGPAGDLEAKRKIDELAAKLKSGSDFAELAYKYSEDDYRVMGGDYGSVHRGQLPSDLEQIVLAQKPGALSAPFKTSLGWHIVLVTFKQPSHQLSYAEVADKIRTALFQRREKQRRIDFIAELKAAATIEYPNP